MTSSYPRVMPNIEPYPQQQHQPRPQSINNKRYSQKLINLSVYRPAYHRIPSTPISPRHPKDAWASMSPEMSPIIVPSMLPATPLNFYTGGYYQQPIAHVTSVILNQRLNSDHLSDYYDTIQHNLQKGLVKDVFFSPAMDADADTREMCQFGSFSSSASSDDNDSISSSTTPPFSSYEQSFSEFLSEQEYQQDGLFDFGLDLATTCATSNQTTTSSYKDIKMAAAAIKPSNNQDLPTPPATCLNEFGYDFQQQQQNKRRCSDSVLEERKKKKHRQITSTPPGNY